MFSPSHSDVQILKTCALGNPRNAHTEHYPQWQPPTYWGKAVDRMEGKGIFSRLQGAHSFVVR
jgi:hypothetical protein